MHIGADITEVEHMSNVDLTKLQFDGAVSGGKMGFMVGCGCVFCCMCLLECEPSSLAG